MHVLHLAWEYPPLIYGGIAPHVAQLAAAQAASGHRVTVVTQAHPDAPADSAEAGLRVVRVAHHPPVLPFAESTLLAWVAGLNNALAAAIVRLPRPDVVHAHDWVTAYAAAIASQGLDLPVVSTFHSTERGRHQGHLPSALARSVHELEGWLASMSEQAITCSTDMAAEVAEQFGVEPAVIPNGVDAAAWQVARRPDPEPLLVFAGRLEWEKGTFDLIDAMPRLRRRIPGLRLVLAGRGGQEEALRARARAKRLGRAVGFAGHLAPAELADLFARAHAVVVPSRYEPFGIVALEAAAAGAPLVLADVGGLSEIAQHGAAAALFPPGDVARLAEAVKETLMQPDSAMARAAAATASLPLRFAWDGIAAATIGVYERVTQRLGNSGGNRPSG
jgi:glycogen(starch) synthase